MKDIEMEGDEWKDGRGGDTKREREREQPLSNLFIFAF
jgi:hypothetical protein